MKIGNQNKTSAILTLATNTFVCNGPCVIPKPSRNLTLKPYVLKFSRFDGPFPPPWERDESLKL